MNDQENVLVGRVGLVISIVLWVLCTWRLGFHLCGGCFGGWSNHREREVGGRRRYQFFSSQDSDSDLSEPIEDEQRQRCTVRWLTRRRIFHGLLWIATFCEIVSYTDISGIHQLSSRRTLAGKIDYFLLTAIGRNFELLAFCIATVDWLRTAIDARPQSVHSGIASSKFWLDCSTRIIVLSTTLLVLVNVSVSVFDFCWSPRAPSQKDVWATPHRKFQTIVEAMCWGIHMLTVSLAIAMTSRRVLVLVPSMEWKRQLSLLSKVVGPMVVSCLAYGTRCGWLIAASIDPNLRDRWDWWIFFVWGPTATVSVVLLYSIRKRDYDIENIVATQEDAIDSNLDGNGDGDLQESLLQPQPPEEAFRAFHNFRHGEDNVDEFSDLASPTPQNIRKFAVQEDA